MEPPFPQEGDLIWLAERDAYRVRSACRAEDRFPSDDDPPWGHPADWVINDGLLWTPVASIWKIARAGQVIYECGENALVRSHCTYIRVDDFVRVDDAVPHVIHTGFQWGEDGDIWLSREPYPIKTDNIEQYWASPVADLVLE